MLQAVIQRDYSSTVSDDLRPTVRYNAVSPKLSKRPTIKLVFLFVLAAACSLALASLSRGTPLQRSDQQSVVPSQSEINSGQTSPTAEVGTSEEQAPANDPSTYSTEVETTIVNGEASTSVKVNGEEVPVPNSQSSVTQQSLPDGSVTIINNQSTSSGSSYSSQSTSLYSHSFQSSAGVN